MTAFIFDIVGADKADRLVKNGIKWEEEMRRVSVMNKGETMKRKMDTIKKTLVQKKNEEVKGKV